MNDNVLQHLSIPVLMLMIRDLEFHKSEYERDGESTTNLQTWIDQCKSVLAEKTED